MKKLKIIILTAVRLRLYQAILFRAFNPFKTEYGENYVCQES